MSAVEARFADEAAGMERDGLVIPKGRQGSIGCVAALPVLAVIVFLGLPRLFLGLGNGKAVGFLLVTLVVGGIFGVILAAAGRLWATRRGEALLARSRERYAALRSGGAWDGTRDAALAVALFGTGALAGSSIAYLQGWYPRQTTTAAGGCGSGCGTAGGCGGGGGFGGGGDGGGGGGGCGGGGGGGGCGGGGGD